MEKENTVADVRDQIIKKIKDEGRMIAWLYKKTKIPYGTLYGCLVKKQFSLSKENLDLINEALNTDFTHAE